MIVGQGEELRVDNGLDLRGGGQVDAVLGGGDDVCRGNGVGACGIAHFLGGGFIALDPARMDIGQTEGLCQIHGRVGARIGAFLPVPRPGATRARASGREVRTELFSQGYLHLFQYSGGWTAPFRARKKSVSYFQEKCKKMLQIC